MSSRFGRFGAIFLYFFKIKGKNSRFWFVFALIFVNYWKRSKKIFNRFSTFQSRKNARRGQFWVKKCTRFRVFQKLFFFNFCLKKASLPGGFFSFYSSSSRKRFSLIRSIMWSLYSSSPLSRRSAAPYAMLRITYPLSALSTVSISGKQFFI